MKFPSACLTASTLLSPLSTKDCTVVPTLLGGTSLIGGMISSFYWMLNLWTILFLNSTYSRENTMFGISNRS